MVTSSSSAKRNYVWVFSNLNNHYAAIYMQNSLHYLDGTMKFQFRIGYRNGVERSSWSLVVSRNINYFWKFQLQQFFLPTKIQKLTACWWNHFVQQIFVCSFPNSFDCRSQLFVCFIDVSFCKKFCKKTQKCEPELSLLILFFLIRHRDYFSVIFTNPTRRSQLFFFCSPKKEKSRIE